MVLPGLKDLLFLSSVTNSTLIKFKEEYDVYFQDCAEINESRSMIPRSTSPQLGIVLIYKC